MSRLAIRRSHALTPADAHQRVDKAAGKLSERFGADCRWDGDVLVIRHPGVNGTVRIGGDEIVVEATLGRALGLFRGRFEAEIARILDRELGA